MLFIYYFIHWSENKCFASAKSYFFFFCKYVFQDRKLQSSDYLCCMWGLSQFSLYYTSFHKGVWLQSHSVYFFLSVYMKYQPKTLNKKRWWINELCRGDTPRPFHIKSLQISVEICLCKSPSLEDWLALKITWWREAQEYINKLCPKRTYEFAS